jgi:hypothetical protein
MGYHALAPQAGRVTDSDRGGRVSVGGMRAGAGGKVVPLYVKRKGTFT